MRGGVAGIYHDFSEALSTACLNTLRDKLMKHTENWLNCQAQMELEN